MANGVHGETIQLARLPAEPEQGQEQGHVLILLHHVTEAIVMVYHQSRMPVIPMHAARNENVAFICTRNIE